MADDVTITVHVRDLTGPGFNSVNRNINQLQRNANQMGGTLRIVGGQLDDLAGSAANAGGSLGGGMGLKGQAIAAGAALGSTLLPSLGALAPMLAGVAVVAGGGALAMDDLKKKAKELKRPFEEWQKVAEKAVAPHTEKAVRSLKGAMKDLNPVIETGAETFGRITEKAAKFADSPAFKSSLAKNAEMGARFVEDFAGSVGTFTQAFLDFGTKSKPALDAWQNLLGGLLDTGLPGMFKELEQGIGGSSDVLDGLAYLINDSLLPSVGKIAGSFAEAFGPLLKEALISAGDLLKGIATIFEGLMEVVEPVARIMADAWHAVTEVLKIGADVAASFAKNVGGALVESLLAVMGIDTSGLTGGFTKLSDWVDRNRDAIRDAFFDIAQGITDMVITGLTMLPQLYTGFQRVADGILLGVDLLVSGLATAFGDLPVVGEKFKEWNDNFDAFAKDARGGLASVGEGIGQLVDEAIPRLSRSKLSMNVDEAKQNLDDLKAKLDDPSLTKERRAKLSADKEAAEQRLKEAKRGLAEFDRKKASATLDASPGPFWSIMGAVRRAKIPKKSGPIDANPGGFWAAVRSISGRVVGTSYINVVQRITKTFSSLNPFRAMGGPVRGYAGGGDVQHFPSGGLIDGPGGPRSDSILATFPSGATARVSDTEYVVQSSAVKKYGVAFLDSLNQGRLKVAALAGGGMTRLARGGVTRAEQDARNSARGELTISHFGAKAGNKIVEFLHQLANADSLKDLVSSLNKWRSVIKKATHGGVENSLLKGLDKAGKALINYQRQHDKISATLEKARALRDSVKSGVLSSANITRAAGAGEGRVTVQGVMGGLIESRDKAASFAGALKALRKKGLSGELIKQIAEAGVEGGGLETAEALMGASKSEIKSMNELQKQIGSAAKSAGNAAADAMYGAGLRAGEGVIAGLEKKQKDIEKAMMKIAKAMEKSIKRALGIKSPSKVMEQVGSFTAEGFAVGMRKNRSVTPAWESMLNVPRTAPGQRSALPASASGGRQVHEIVINLDGKTIARQIYDPLRHESRIRGTSLGGN